MAGLAAVRTPAKWECVRLSCRVHHAEHGMANAWLATRARPRKAEHGPQTNYRGRRFLDLRSDASSRAGVGGH